MHAVFCFLKFGRENLRAGIIRAMADVSMASIPGPVRTETYEVLSSEARRGLEAVSVDNAQYDSVLKFVYAEAAEAMNCWRSLMKLSGSLPSEFLGDEKRLLIPVQCLSQREEPTRKDTRRLFVPIQKNPDRTLASFRTHWRDHASLIFDKVPGVLGYIQNQTVDSAYSQPWYVWDGIAEFWFESMDAVLKLGETHPELLAEIAADELLFLKDAPLGNYVAQPVAALTEAPRF
jgi:hypothetical protein